ncbi:hypothetical protein EJ04DRAFT_478706, partial [Polyplosphaeria fusca]
MATRKRNEWLDADESDQEERGYDSEEEESRARTLPSSKRQKVQHDESEPDSEADLDDVQSQTSDAVSEDNPDNIDDTQSVSRVQSTTSRELSRLTTLASSLPRTRFDPAPTRLTAPLQPSKPHKDKSGIIYLSRVPPFMKPSALRTLLSPHGTLTRIYLTPESSQTRTTRLRAGGTRRKLYLDGWVEFAHKRDAKRVAENLNAQSIGGRKRGRWFDEVWNVKYLKGVKWGALVEQIRNEEAERGARMRDSMVREKRENERFVAGVERGRWFGEVWNVKARKG